MFEISLIEVNYMKEGGLSGCTNLFLVGFLLFSFQFPFLFIFKSFPFLLLFLCLLLLFFSLGQFLVSFLLSLLPLTFLSSFAFSFLTLRLFLLFLCILLLKNKMWYVPVKKISHIIIYHGFCDIPILGTRIRTAFRLFISAFTGTASF